MFGTPAEPVTMSASRPAAQFSVDVPLELLEAMTGGSSIAPRISRAEALQVPAVLRSRNLICGSLCTLPIRVHGPDRKVITNVQYLVPQPDPEIASSVVMAQTIEDLYFESVSWWRVKAFGWHGFPVQARHVPVESVHVAPAGALMPSQARISPDQPFALDGQVLIDGIPVPDNEIIRFDSPNPPLLRHAARAIRTCLLLDTAAALYAKEPMPLGYFTPREGVDPASDEEIQQVLDDWESARAKRAWGYVNAALDTKQLSWSPKDLQLADARQHAVLEIARAAGVDPEDLGVSTTSRTYANQEQRWQALINLTLGAYVSTVQERLSMRDVLPRGYTAQIDFSGFLRGDALTRMQTYKAGLEVGAFADDNEVREAEGKPALTPAQRTVRKPAQPPPIEQGNDMPVVASAREPATVFDQDSADLQRFSFDDEEAYASFRVNEAKRTISGMVVPWRKIALSGGYRWRFSENSLRWLPNQLDRVKLNLGHDRYQSVGFAAAARNTSVGLDLTFKIAEVPEGDRAIALAAGKAWDGLSVEIDFEDQFGDDWQEDPNDRTTRLVHQAKLMHVALTPAPAFDDARVAAVAASKPRQGDTNGREKGRQGQPRHQGIQVRSERGLIRRRSG